MNHPVSSDPLHGLKPAEVQQLIRATQALQAGDRRNAALLLQDLARSAPGHPEVLQLRAVCRAGDGYAMLDQLREALGEDVGSWAADAVAADTVAVDAVTSDPATAARGA